MAGSIDWLSNTDFNHKGMRQIYFACFIAFLNSAINGYDLSLFWNLGSQESFGWSFANAANFTTASALFSLTASMLQIGSIVGCFVVGYAADVYGRRGGMSIGSIIILVGVVLEVSSTILGLFVFGRFLIGFGVVFVTTAGPTYTVEVAHPQFRGRAGATYNTGWNVGAIPCSIILFGCTYLDNGPGETLAWRLPVAIQGVFSLIVLVGCFFIPESPRWLMSKGKEDEARQFLIHYHGNDKADHPIVEFTMVEMRDALAEEERQNGASYQALFTGRAMLYRMGLLLSIAFFSQYAGNWLAGGFTAVVYQYFGLTTPQQTLGASIIPGVVSFITSQFGSAYVDKLGRRTMLLYGTISYVACFVIIGVCLEIFNPNAPTADSAPRIGWAIFAFVILQIFNIFYSFTWTPLNALYPVEILPYSARAKGMALCQLFINAANVVQSWILVYAANSLGFRMIWFYMCFNVFAVAIIYKFFPETKGLTLEAIDELFQAPGVVARSLERFKMVGSTIEEGDADKKMKPVGMLH